MSTFISKLLTRMQPAVASADPDEELQARDAFALRVGAVLDTLGAGALDGGDDELAIRLDGAIEEYLEADAEEDRESIVLHVARGIVEASGPAALADHLAEALPRLRPRIRPRSRLVLHDLQLDSEGADPRPLAWLPVTEELGAEIVYDTPASMVSVSAEQLAAWGLTAAHALRCAVANLRAAGPSPFLPVGDGVFSAEVGDSYDSARMLLVDEVLALPLTGAPVALPASRDTLVLTGTDNLGGLYRLLEIAVQALDRPTTDTLQPAVLVGRRWRDWLPPAGHTMREPFYELALRGRGTSYAELQDLLERRNELAGRELFVSSYGVLHAGRDAARSHAVWPPVRGWLPEADLVSVIHPEDERYIVVPRGTLVELASHLLSRVPDVHPPYDAFDGVPDRDLWNRLRKHALREGVMGGDAAETRPPR